MLYCTCRGECFCLLSSTGVGVLKGLLYAVGGHDGPLVRKSCEVYDPTSNSWRQVADMNMCRRNAGKTACPPHVHSCQMFHTAVRLN